MKLFGEDLKKDEILKIVGDISQICDVKTFEYTDGKSNGLRAVNIKSISGLDINILIDRGMDISSLYYKSIPLFFKSKVRETSPVYFESRGQEFLRTFYAGFLTTGGLSNTGWPCTDNGEDYGLHDRISNISAERVNINESWEEDDYKISINGKVREAKFFGDYLELDREIITFLSKPKLILRDKVQNIGFRDSAVMILYHFNFGFPLLSNSSELLLGKTNILAADENTEKCMKDYNKFDRPLAEFIPQLFFHDVAADNEGNINLALVNKNFEKDKGIGISFKFKKNQLPCINQMKNLSYGEYICSIEPGSNFVRGREFEKNNDNLRVMKPGEFSEFLIEIEILKSNEDIDSFKQKLSS